MIDCRIPEFNVCETNRDRLIAYQLDRYKLNIFRIIININYIFNVRVNAYGRRDSINENIVK